MRLILRVSIDRENQGLRVVGEATSGEEAIEMRPQLYPDVVVLDHKMPGLSGIETAKILLRDEPELPIVLYSAFLDADVMREATAVGIRACVIKGDMRELI